MEPETGGAGDIPPPTESDMTAILEWIIAKLSAGTPDGLSVSMGTHTVDIHVPKRVFDSWCASVGATGTRSRTDALGVTDIATAGGDGTWLVTLSAYTPPTPLSGVRERP